jgi:transcriptional regulator with XRE-family HTH domain
MQRGFDIDALFAVLESTKSMRGLSWRAVASEVGLPDHTVFTRMSRGQVPETETLWKLARWLDVPLETFADGAVLGPDFPEPTGGMRSAGEGVGEPDRPAARRSLDLDALYEALESKKREHELSWRTLASDLGLADHTVFSRMSRGQVPDVETLLALTTWLGVPLDTFARGDAVAPNGRERTLERIRHVLGADGALTEEDAEAITSVLRAAYDQVVGEGVVLRAGPMRAPTPEGDEIEGINRSTSRRHLLEAEEDLPRVRRGWVDESLVPQQLTKEILSQRLYLQKGVGPAGDHEDAAAVEAEVHPRRRRSSGRPGGDALGSLAEHGPAAGPSEILKRKEAHAE